MIYPRTSTSDLFILLSHREGLPISVLEAMACKIPIIVSDIKSLKEVIQNGISGFLVNRFNYNLISEVTYKLIYDKKLKSKIIENAYKIVSKKFDINLTIRNYENLYIKLLNSKKS